MPERLSEKPGFKAIEHAISKERPRTPEEARAKVSEHIKEVVSQVTSQVPQTAQTTKPATSPQTNVALEKFVQLAFDTSVTAAVEKIAQINNPYLIDAFHDLLIEKFVEELKAAGKLK